MNDVIFSQKFPCLFQRDWPISALRQQICDIDTSDLCREYEQPVLDAPTFVGDSGCLNEDAAFGVKDSLVAPFEQTKGDTKWRSPFDFVTVPNGEET